MSSLPDALPRRSLSTCAIECFGPLEPVYDYELAAKTFTRENIAARPKNLWRYRELLPITGEPLTGFTSGFTPLVKRDAAGRRAWASRELYIKDDRRQSSDVVGCKDRVVSVAATRAVELGFKVFACASTGNLGNSVAAHAARLGLRVLRLHPRQPRSGQGDRRRRSISPQLVAIKGNYDDVNRLCSQVADKYRLGLREHQPAGLLRRRREDVRRSRSSSSLAGRCPEARRCRPWPAARCCRASARGLRESARKLGLAVGDVPKIYAAQAAGSSAGGAPPCTHGEDHPGAGEAQHDRQVDRDRQPGGRLPGGEDA